MKIGYDAGDRGEPEYPEQTNCTDGHNWIVGLYTAKREDTGQSVPLTNKGLHVYCGNCPETLSIPETNAIINEHAKLLRVRDAAEAQRDTLRKTKHFGDLTEIERELYDALADTQEGG